MTDTTQNTASTNVSTAEIDRFNAASEHWWDTEGEFGALHEINPLRLQYVERHSQGIVRKPVVDIGCGGGILSESMAQAGAQVTGIDLSDKAIEAAQQHAKAQDISIDYQVVAAETFAAQQAEQFSVVTCMEMLEHVPDPGSIVMAAARLTKPSGHCFFSTINRNLKSFAMMIVGAEYLTRTVPRGTHTYTQFIKPSELADTLRQAGLLVKHMTGIRFDPLTRHHRLDERDLDVNYLIHAVKPQ